MNIQKELKQIFPEITGALSIQSIGNTVILSGNVSIKETSKQEFFDKLVDLTSGKYPNKLISNNVTTEEFSVIDESVSTNKELNEHLDEVDIVYYGYLDVSAITPNDKYKVLHENNRDKLDNCVKVLNFISPIILDSNLKVIDGNFRLQLAKANDIQKVLVAVINDDGKRAEFLRLALNRTAEFQRWNYREVDDYVDNTPQAQPILEPIGFFGQKVLPTTFFSDTVIQYIIDPFNEKQKQYSQEEGLAEWAKYRREQMAKLSAEKRAKKPKKTNAISLFDLQPKEEDFEETYDIDVEMEEFVEKYKKIAGDITDREDAKKKADIEANGGVWQRSHRSSKEVAEDKRNEGIQKIEDSELLTEEEKCFVIGDIDSYFDMINDIEGIAKLIRKNK